MKKSFAAGLISLVLVAGAAQAQQAPTMDPAVIEESTASSSAGMIVPLLGLLLMIVVISGASGSNAVAPIT